MELCSDCGIEDIEIVYVTRAYMTRHGAGPFPHESINLDFEDKTNVPNQYQGSMRYDASAIFYV